MFFSFEAHRRIAAQKCRIFLHIQQREWLLNYFYLKKQSFMILAHGLLGI